MLGSSIWRVDKYHTCKFLRVLVSNSRSRLMLGRRLQILTYLTVIYTVEVSQELTPGLRPRSTDCSAPLGVVILMVFGERVCDYGRPALPNDFYSRDVQLKLLLTSRRSFSPQNILYFFSHSMLVHS